MARYKPISSLLPISIIKFSPAFKMRLELPIYNIAVGLGLMHSTTRHMVLGRLSNGNNGYSIIQLQILESAIPSAATPEISEERGWGTSEWCHFITYQLWNHDTPLLGSPSVCHLLSEFLLYPCDQTLYRAEKAPSE